MVGIDKEMVSLEPTGTLGTKGRKRMLTFIWSDSSKTISKIVGLRTRLTVVLWLVVSEPGCSILHFGFQ